MECHVRRGVEVKVLGWSVVGFDDDITVVYGESIEEVELTVALSIAVVGEKMNSRKLGLDHHKTEMMLIIVDL